MSTKSKIIILVICVLLAAGGLAAALYFNGCNAAELAEQMRLIMTDSAARDALLHRERSLARQFSSVDYFGEIRNIIEEFRPFRQTWG